MKIICLLKGFWINIKGFVLNGRTVPVDGCDYKEQESKDPNVQILKCKKCGKISKGHF